MRQDEAGDTGWAQVVQCFVQPGKDSRCSSNSSGKPLKWWRQGSDMKVSVLKP